MTFTVRVAPGFRYQPSKGKDVTARSGLPPGQIKIFGVYQKSVSAMILFQFYAKWTSKWTSNAPSTRIGFSSKTISFSMKTHATMVLHLRIVFVSFSYRFQPSTRKR